ncbi:hypothetical protein T484DRAFT_1846471 [Baffinella frigidus]|nr:hypothetical protein T484DRAFT_1846471 [Cryptophyta sp. CCMP2293]
MTTAELRLEAERLVQAHQEETAIRVSHEVDLHHAKGTHEAALNDARGTHEAALKDLAGPSSIHEWPKVSVLISVSIQLGGVRPPS